MPTDAECLAFYNKEHAKGIAGLDEREEAIFARWPEKADRMVYYAWIKKRADALMNAHEMTPIRREDLKKMIATMNYNRATDRGKLVNVLQRTIVPWLPVGNDRYGEIYRISPGAYGLRPDQPKPKIDRELVSMNVLGVNTNVQPKIPFQSRKANFSEESTKSDESDDLETGGFVFHQIGNLEQWGDEPENLTSYDDAANGDWLPTDFYVAVRFGRNGAANGVYIIHDFYPVDESGSRNRKIVTECWGILPGGGPRFSIAKIANEITDLRFGRTFDLTEALDYPVELVRAVVTPEDAVIRVTVA
ncbi:MAG: hypothetical protein M1813_000517 [Trichoglossum hirsutum]|jgi:hypothetical protein|nr:MAG: hypothetical protein M1813_000517 [Trichoglossum hirsutum]